MDLSNFNDETIIRLRDIAESKLDDTIKECENLTYIAKQYLKDAKELNDELIKRHRKNKKFWEIWK